MATPPKPTSPAKKPSSPAAASTAASAKAEAPADAPKKAGRRKLVPIALALLVAGGGGGWFYMQHKNAEAKTAPAPEKKKVPAFLAIDQFTVNLAGGGGDRFLQVAFALEVADPKVAEELKAQMPVVRGRLLLLLSSKTAEELVSVAGKQKLMGEILAEARAPLSGSELPGKGVDNVHFSSFVIQ
ncbi:MAG: flagellar basal body-associated protein FliL [Proteobacteria bacterium]|nr:flagellar basal body-associated protein FliL [Pseudomonadota bacterium]